MSPASSNTSADAALFDAAFPAISWDVLLDTVRHYVQAGGAKKAVLVVGGHSQLVLLRDRCQAMHFPPLVAAPDGYADMGAFRAEWDTIWRQSSVSFVAVTGPALLRVMFHGLMRLEEVSLLVFDDVTGAAGQHPYCLVMRHFYGPAQRQGAVDGEAQGSDAAAGGRRAAVPPLAPRVLAFGLSDGIEAGIHGRGVQGVDARILSRRNALRRLQTMGRDFFSAAVGVAEAGPEDDASAACRVGRVRFVGERPANAVELGDEDALPENSHAGLVYVETADEQRALLLCQRALGRGMDVAVGGEDPVLTARLLFVLGLRSFIDAARSGATDAALGRARFARHYGHADALLRSFRDDPAWSLRMPSTGALLHPDIAADVLSRFCSAFSRRSDGSARSRAGRLWQRTFTVKLYPDGTDGAVDAADATEHLPVCNANTVLDPRPAVPRTQSAAPLDERRRFLTRIVLPAGLRAAFPALPSSVDGPVAVSRSVSRKRAAFVACRLLLAASAMDEHLLPSGEANAARDDGSVDTGALLADDGGPLLDLRGLAEILPPCAAELAAPPSGGDSNGGRMLWVYPIHAKVCARSRVVSEYVEAGAKGLQSTGGDDSFLWLTPDSVLLAAAGIDCFGDSRWSIAFLQQLPSEDAAPLLVPTHVPLGVGHFVRVSLGRGRQVSLDREQWAKALRAQVVFFGSFFLGQQPAAGRREDADPATESDSSGGDEAAFDGPLPDDLHQLYLLLPRGGDEPDYLDIGRARREWDALLARVRAAGRSVAQYRVRDDEQERDGEADVAVNWGLIERCLAVHCPATGADSGLRVLEYLRAARDAQDGVFIEVPAYTIHDRRTGPDSTDFSTFCLKRLAVYAPYSRLWYRPKGVAPARFTPDTPILDGGSVSLRQYMAARFSLRSELQQPLLEVRHVESFAEPVAWTIAGNDDAGEDSLRHRKRRQAPSADAKRRRQAPETADLSGTVLLPEFAVASPLPYAMVRQCMLYVPRLVHDVDRQCCIRRFFAEAAADGAEAGPLRSRPLPLQPLPGGPAAAEQSAPLQHRNMVVALTAPTAAAPYDCERMEILGDSFLKYAATLDTFALHGAQGEGRLSAIRQSVVSNANLTRLGLRLGVLRWASVAPFFAKLYAPPTLLRYLLPLLPPSEDGSLERAAAGLFDPWRRWKRILRMERRGRDRVYRYCVPSGSVLPPVSSPARGKELEQRRRLGQALSGKCVADLVEAILAAHVLNYGPEQCIAWMQSKGLLTEGISSVSVRDPMRVLGLHQGVGKAAGAHRAQASSDVRPYTPSETNFPYGAVEAILGYRFKERRLLFVACTHASVDPAACSGRLEWLGDAALDWLVTRHYWQACHGLTPMQLTECRQAAVSNNAFARCVVSLGLHRFVRIDAARLQLNIGAFAAAGSGELGDAPKALGDAPKALADLLEALAGAVLIDCRFSDAVFSSTFGPLLDAHLAAPRTTLDAIESGDANPVRALLLALGRLGVARQSIRYVFTDSGGAAGACSVVVDGRAVGAGGRGNTRAAAKRAASAAALEHLRSGDNWLQFAQQRK